ncbi:succinate dehydrogenase, hydrophobic membrane anchor protein [Kiloniella sp. b19]|uniref:succinate dehydrogenase, hydrophobic membrane anchor protein n=1 Tax=Kiloniella sp. GXU_MW_B19 TaxID=3141326 RepID=UPI0031DF6ABF
MSMRSHLGRVKGLGSAREGTSHWWSMRVSSVALVPLTLWFVFSVASMAGASHAEFVAWVQNPVVAGLLILFILVGLKHSREGLQVVFEDYLHADSVKIPVMMLSSGAHMVAAVVCVLSVLMILFKG